MPPGHQSVLGLVELAAEDDFMDHHDVSNCTELQGEFQHRLSGWVRSRDECRRLNNNRVCVILNGMSSEGELQLAAAKLERVFQEPHYYLGRPVPLEVSAQVWCLPTASEATRFSPGTVCGVG